MQKLAMVLFWLGLQVCHKFIYTLDRMTGDCTTELLPVYPSAYFHQGNNYILCQIGYNILLHAFGIK